MMMDFGFTITLPRENLRPLCQDKDHPQKPCFAIKCHLADIQPAGDISRWSRTACEYLEEVLDGEPCYLVVKVHFKAVTILLLCATFTIKVKVC